MELVLVFCWVALAVLAGAVASAKGRSGFGYFLLTLFLSPVVGLLAAAMMPSLLKAQSADQRPRMPCPKCAELILVNAQKCAHCGEDLSEFQAAVAQEREHARQEREQARADRAKRSGAVGRALGSAFGSLFLPRK